jgi:hypothetical protein
VIVKDGCEHQMRRRRRQLPEQIATDVHRLLESGAHVGMIVRSV